MKIGNIKKVLTSTKTVNGKTGNHDKKGKKNNRKKLGRKIVYIAEGRGICHKRYKIHRSDSK